MKSPINSKDIKDFLQDFRVASETSILEEGKEKDEIIEIAKAKGINLKDSRDLSGFKTIYTFANKANKNKARLPKEALLKALPTMIGKPVDIDHNRKYVIGHYIDYRYKQKEDMVIAYGVFYKGNFGKEWEKAKELFKAKKLSTSYEIWCPTDKRRERKDGTFDLLEQEIAGGALLFNEEPAFEDAKVLELAKTNLEQQSEELVFAYKQDELIVSERNVIDDTDISLPTLKKIKCSNCQHETEIGPTMINIKCPNCFAILNNEGQMLYPPQIIDFKMLCPSCKTNNWLILSHKEDSTEIKCNQCAKEYKIEFSKVEANELLEGFDFLYTSNARCLQCGTNITVSGISSIKTKNVKCHKCGLEFSYDIAYEQYRKINSITLKADTTINKSSAKGDQKIMENNEQKKIEDPSVETSPVTEKVIESIEPVASIEEAKEIKTENTAPVASVSEPLPVTEVAPTEITKLENSTSLEVSTEKSEQTVQVQTSNTDTVSTSSESQTVNEIETKEVKVEIAKLDKAEIRKIIKKIVAIAKKCRKKDKTKWEEEKSKLEAELKKASTETELYKKNAKVIIERRSELGEACQLTDEELLNDDKFARAKVEIENALLRAKAESTSDKVGEVSERSSNWYAEKRKEIDNLAFGHINKNIKKN